MQNSRPIIAITLGEPAGIGPEIALRAAWEVRNEISPILIGDLNLLKKQAAEFNHQIILQSISMDQLPFIRQSQQANVLKVIDLPLAKTIQPGYPSPDNAKTILNWLNIAMQGASQKYFDAIATAPIQKSIINAAGIPFTGHTEYLAQYLQTDQVVMMLAGRVHALPSSFLRVALATTHLPIKNISNALNKLTLENVIHILHHELQEKFAIANPRILVSGLNPHAGENGYLGTEEIDTITPVIEKAKKKGINITGPLPADTLFLPHHISQADCFLVMYHDQGLPVLKYATFGHGVNITLGLPIIRTSVDHGTALDIAKQGRGLADYSSMLEAIRIAADMATHQKN